jgi:hypothetical protein
MIYGPLTVLDLITVIMIAAMKRQTFGNVFGECYAPRKAKNTTLSEQFQNLILKHDTLTFLAWYMNFNIKSGGVRLNLLTQTSPLTLQTYSIFSFMCLFCRSLFVLLYFFFWSLCCLYFFDWLILYKKWRG